MGEWSLSWCSGVGSSRALFLQIFFEPERGSRKYCITAGTLIMQCSGKSSGAVRNLVNWFSGKNHWNCCQQTLDFKAKMHQIRLQPGLWPKPYWKSLQRSPSLPGWIKGGLLQREGREGDGEGKGRTGGEFRQINIHPWSVWLISSNGVSVFQSVLPQSALLFVPSVDFRCE